jgi:hypothetical protein
MNMNGKSPHAGFPRDPPPLASGPTLTGRAVRFLCLAAPLEENRAQAAGSNARRSRCIVREIVAQMFPERWS